ncbi:phosphatidylserine decarboxylase-domain-containing protein [Mycena belliarum]|uniref:Phosphatidylserine decarboxylase proenzyme 2 n=1 Tax=Mycena belliarum TaxID=1033014 RepID=A0AAD6TX46_9AGAR|nr:phosphatidylserine decarboxylase-domain-containing protein [Mycena belliae]
MVKKDKLRRALKLPFHGRAAAGTTAVGHSTFTPRPGEQPIVFLRVQVLGCTDLLAKDRNGFSDPFVVASLLHTRVHTATVKKTLNPVFAAKDATWDLPIYLSVADKLGVLELVVWDKDVLSRKDYLGEAGVAVEDWFADRAKAWDSPANVPFAVPIVSSRPGTPAQGAIQLRIGFVAPPPPTAHAPNQAVTDFDAVYRNLVKNGRVSLVSAPPTEGVGTVRSHLAGPAFEDDGGLSSASSDASDSEDDDDSDSEAGEFDERDEEGLPEATPSASRLQALYTPPEISVIPGSPALEGVPMSAGPGSGSGSGSAGGKTPTAGSPLTTPTPSSTGEAPALGGDKDKKSKPSFIALPLTQKFLSRSRPTTPGEASKDKDLAKDAGKKRFRRSWTGGSAGTAAPLEESTEKEKDKDKEKAKEGKRRRPKPQRTYSLGAEVGAAGGAHANDIVGIVMLEIAGAVDLPRLKNMTRTSFDMDPFVVISFGKKVFRTRVIRHSLNPVWDEKLLFHVRRYEIGYEVRLTVLDWDKLSSNDYIGAAAFPVAELLADAPQPLPEGGSAVAGSASTPATEEASEERGTHIPLYAETEGGDHAMKEFKLKLETSGGSREPVLWESKHTPLITFRAKYQPYSLLRQRFWRQYLKQYDTDDTASISHVEITSMLDSLGSTLTGSTVDSFFTRFGKDPQRDDLTIEEAIRCLETEVMRPESERRRVDGDSSGIGASLSPSPAPGQATPGEPRLAELDFAGPALEVDFSGEGRGFVTEPSEMPYLKPGMPTHASESSSDADLEEVESSGSASGSSPVSTSASPNASLLTPSASAPVTAPSAGKKTRFRRPRYRKTQSSSVTTASTIASVSASPAGSSISDDSFERVINVKNCPLCHRPRMNSKAEVDIITHIAVCASQDWNIVDRIVVGNFVTANQAQRKWYTKIIGKISSGDYRLGANSANIIVQNRMTGQLEEEKMQVYVRLGIRLLYKGMKSRMEGGRARRLLKSLSIKQGVKYDAPESAADIPAFIEFHQLKVEEILDPLDSFKNFNQFFYRKLKPSARPVEKPDDSYRLVSAADCRFMAFESVSEATRLWIKGREFTVARLIGDAYKHEAERYTGGALAIFRLAPQDYHRFHSPVDGTIGNMTYIAGEYYTVNPQAIRTALDVYGENARKIVPIDSPQFGRVIAVCVGAMMVGSIETTLKEGDAVKRGQEFGYFAFGGSTVVLLFEKDAVVWDEDLLVNGRASLETLVRVGMGIGTGTRKPGRS